MPVEDLTGGGGQAENPDPAALPAPVGAEAEVAADAAPAAAPGTDLGVLTTQVAQILGAVGILGDQLQKLSVRSARQDDELAAQRTEIEQGRAAVEGLAGAPGTPRGRERERGRGRERTRAPRSVSRGRRREPSGGRDEYGRDIDRDSATAGVAFDSNVAGVDASQRDERARAQAAGGAGSGATGEKAKRGFLRRKTKRAPPPGFKLVRKKHGKKHGKKKSGSSGSAGESSSEHSSQWEDEDPGGSGDSGASGAGGQSEVVQNLTNIPYFPEGNPRPERIYREENALFSTFTEADWANLFTESSWQKIGVGARREIECTYPVEARLLDIETAIGFGVHSQDLLPVLAATRQYLQERLDGCLDVVEAGGDERRIKVVRVMQDIMRDKRMRRPHRSDAHTAMWERAEKQLSRTTDKKVAEMLHFGRFNETPYGKGWTGGGTPGGKRPQSRRQPRSGPPAGASAAGRAAYDKDVKGKAPWLAGNRTAGGKD